MQSNFRNRLAGISLVLLSSSAIAVVPTSARLAFDSGANTASVVTLRGIVGMILLVLFMAVAGQSVRLPKRTLVPCAAAGLAHALVAYGFIGSVAYIPAGLAVLVYCTHPLLLAFVFHWQGRERLTLRKMMLAFTAFAALAVVLGGGTRAPDATGVALAGLASLAVCAVILLGARAQNRGATSAQVNLVTLAVATVVCAIGTTAGDLWSLPSGLVGWLGLAGAGAGVTIGLVAFFAAFRFIGAARATMISNAEPLLAIVFAAVVLGERFDLVQWTGVAVALTALVLFEASPAA